METTATVINVKFGTIEENGQDWAQVNILDSKITSNDGFHGVQPAKLKVNTDNRNELASRMSTQLRKSSVPMPCQMKLTLEQQLVANEMRMTVVDFELLK